MAEYETRPGTHEAAGQPHHVGERPFGPEAPFGEERDARRRDREPHPGNRLVADRLEERAPQAAHGILRSPPGHVHADRPAAPREGPLVGPDFGLELSLLEAQAGELLLNSGGFVPGRPREADVKDQRAGDEGKGGQTRAHGLSAGR